MEAITGAQEGCVTAASSQCSLSPLALHKVQTGFWVFLGDFVQMKRLKLQVPAWCQSRSCKAGP